MAVFSAFRKESTAQYVETAKDIAVLTRACCLKMPKRYVFFGVQKICELADTVYIETTKANSIYPTTQQEYQMRRNHLIEALATIQALASELEIVIKMFSKNQSVTSWMNSSGESWGELVNKEIHLITNVKKSDAQRFKNLK